MSGQITEVMAALAEYAGVTGQTNLSQHPGCVQITGLTDYEVWVNPHAEENATPGGVVLTPWSALFIRSGLPVAMVDPFTGTAISGAEDTIVADLRAAIGAAK